MIGDYKIVDFDNYCPTCIHKDDPEIDHNPKYKDGKETPCYYCMSEPARIDSRKPAKYEEKN